MLTVVSIRVRLLLSAGACQSMRKEREMDMADTDVCAKLRNVH